MGAYFDELSRSMINLAKDPRTLFIGQAVSSPGTAMYGTLEGISLDKRLEFPVAEEFQMGASIGMSMTGLVPVSIYPRWNFLLLAMNQLVNHLDKIQLMTNNKPLGHVIVRTSIGSERPLHPQSQHVGDFTDAIRLMCRSVEVVRLEEPNQIFSAYSHALNRDDGVSSILVEYGDFYSEK